MNKNTLIIIIVVFLITNCLNIGLFFNNKKTIEKMADTGNISAEIKNQINKIYKADIISIRNLAEISKRLQEGRLSIPGNLKIEGNAEIEGNADMKLLKANRIILSGRDISNRFDQLNNKNSSLESRLNNLNNRLNNSTNILTNKITSSVNGINSRFKARFPNDHTLDLGGHGRIILGGDYFHFTGPNGKGARQLAARHFLRWGGW